MITKTFDSFASRHHQFFYLWVPLPASFISVIKWESPLGLLPKTSFSYLFKLWKLFWENLLSSNTFIFFMPVASKRMFASQPMLLSFKSLYLNSYFSWKILRNAYKNKYHLLPPILKHNPIVQTGSRYIILHFYLSLTFHIQSNAKFNHWSSDIVLKFVFLSASIIIIQEPINSYLSYCHTLLTGLLAYALSFFLFILCFILQPV